MTLGGGDPSSHVIVDVFRSVLAHAGVKGEASDRVLDQVMTEFRQGTGGDCALRFVAHAGELEITFSRDGRDFHTSCPVPVR